MEANPLLVGLSINMELPKKWMLFVFHGKSHLEMDDLEVSPILGNIDIIGYLRLQQSGGPMTQNGRIPQHVEMVTQHRLKAYVVVAGVGKCPNVSHHPTKKGIFYIQHIWLFR